MTTHTYTHIHSTLIPNLLKACCSCAILRERLGFGYCSNVSAWVYLFKIARARRPDFRGVGVRLISNS